MLFFTLLISTGSISLYGQESTKKNQSQGNTNILPALYVMEQETANQRPANTYESPISNLDFDPRVDMQTRNMAEAQGDLSVRGGTFENTGIQIGSATLLDPQTGHYSTEIPVAPEMLGEPRLLTGANNALHGFNSSTGTVSYSWSEITKGGSLTLGGGDHNLNFNVYTTLGLETMMMQMIGLGVLKLKLQDLKVMEQYHLEIMHSTVHLQESNFWGKNHKLTFSVAINPNFLVGLKCMLHPMDRMKPNI